MVGGTHQHRLVLHHHQRVPARGQLLENRDQLVGVARVEAHGRLVEHVERIGERCAKRMGQLDALRLAARERARQAIEGEVVEIHALEEAEPGLQLGDHGARDLALARRELEPTHEAQRLRHRLLRDRRDVLARQPHEQRLRPQPCAVTRRAGQSGLVALHDEAVARLVRLLLQAFQERDRAAEALAALEQELPMGGGELAPRRVERHAALTRQLLEPRPEDRAPRARPGIDRPLAQGERRVGHDEVGRECEHVAEPAAGRAYAERAVEREQRGLGPHRRRSAIRALPALAPLLGDPLAPLEREPSLATAKRLLARLGEPRRFRRLPAEAVHHDRHLARPASQPRRRIERHDLALQQQAREAGVREVARLLLPAHALREGDRRQHQHRIALGPRRGFGDDALRAVGGHSPPAIAAVDGPEPREQQPQIIVDLGGGAHGRARAARGRHLLDRDGGGQAVDHVHVGPRQALEELARVARDRLDVAALALGVDRVECERGLARARDPCDHGQLAPGQVEVEVLEVVLARAADLYGRDAVGFARVQRGPRDCGQNTASDGLYHGSEGASDAGQEKA